jgi:hypothetical protein
MSLKTIGYAQLDSRIAEIGEDGVLMDVASRVSEGELPSAIARSYGMPLVCLRSFIESKGMDVVGLARRAMADELAMKGLVVARDATIGSLPVDKFQAEYYQKQAAIMSKKEWGNDKETGGGGITVVVNRGCSMEVEGGVLRITETLEKGYPEPVATGAVLEGEVTEI